MRANWLKRGIATLPTILILSIIILTVAVAAVAIAASLGNTANSQRISSQALSDAKTGADDAVERLIRYGNNCLNFNGVGGCTASSTITIGSNDYANVTMTASSTTGVVTIVSQGVSFNRYRKLQEVVSIDATTGAVNILSITEIAD